MQCLFLKKTLFVCFILLNFYSINAMTTLTKASQIAKSKLSVVQKLLCLGRINIQQLIPSNFKRCMQTSTIPLNNKQLKTEEHDVLQEETSKKLKISKNYNNFFKCVQEGDSTAVAIFLKDENFDPNIIDYSNTELALSALHYAVLANHIEIVDLLISDSRTNLFIRDGQGNTPLFYAQNNLDTSICIKLFYAIELRLDIILITKPQFYTSYHATPKLYIDPCYHPLARETYIHNKNFIRKVMFSNKHLGQEALGKLFLYHAVCENDFEDVLMLLKLGANPNAVIDIDEEHCVRIDHMAKSKLMLAILKKYGAELA
ncbi:MAG: ankyrin repeat domain-containing protein [Candidatus Babeliales bacterium]|nr:ankyrin repeat domain-containing protein [Candidatus Babeliales bacterium]